MKTANLPVLFSEIELLRESVLDAARGCD